jgi:NADPH-dependent glutamate synthase beta subunit-like oxidoreductase
MRTLANQQGQTKSFDSALHKVVETIPLPLVALSVCFHPERAGLDKQAILEKAEMMRAKTRRSREVTEISGNPKVAVLGSGPAGLTAAYELGIRGCDVTVLDSLPEPGGMLRKCIPESRLAKEVLAKEIEFIRDSGVKFRMATTVGKDLSFKDLKNKGYKAIFIGVGAHKSAKLRIDGADLRGVVNALDFLQDVNFGEKIELGKDVIVIGGGNVAMDAAKSAMQMGADEVTILYRRSRDEMPAIPWEVKETEEKGVKIEFLVSPKEIHGEGGKVSSIDCLRMQLGEPDESGRRASIPLAGSDFSRKADTIIVAVGETPDLGFLPDGMEVNNDGTLCVNPITLETNVEGIFAGGDAVTGPATVIEAIRAGKVAAESIESYLRSLEG